MILDAALSIAVSRDDKSYRPSCSFLRLIIPICDASIVLGSAEPSASRGHLQPALRRQAVHG